MILFSLTAIGIFGSIGCHMLSLVLLGGTCWKWDSSFWLLHARLPYQLLLLLLVSIEWFYSSTWENWFWHWYFIMHMNLVTTDYGRFWQPVEWKLSEISDASVRSSPNFTSIFPLWYLGTWFHSKMSPPTSFRSSFLNSLFFSA